MEQTDGDTANSHSLTKTARRRLLSSFSLLYLLHVLANHQHSDPQKDDLRAKHASDRPSRPHTAPAKTKTSQQKRPLLDIEGASRNPVVPVSQLAVLWTNHQASGGLVHSADPGGEGGGGGARVGGGGGGGRGHSKRKEKEN